MIFITGGTGLVGSHILLYLSQNKVKYRSLKRSTSSLEICKDVFKYYNSEQLFEEINWVTGDVNDIPSLENAMSGCKKVIHAAAIVSFHNEDIDMMNKINVEGTKNIVNVSLGLDIEKICHISSIASLGSNINDEIIEESSFYNENKKESNYALSKYYAEQEVWRASQEGLDMVILNPSVILGPGDWNKGSSQIFQKIYNGLKFFTSGSTGYVDVTDVANCAIQLLESNYKNERFIINSENLNYRTVFDWIAENFGKDKATIKVNKFLKEIAWRVESIRSLFSQKKPLITRETANSAMRKRHYSNQKIVEALNYKFVPIKESVKKYCNWFSDKLVKE